MQSFVRGKRKSKEKKKRSTSIISSKKLKYHLNNLLDLFIEKFDNLIRKRFFVYLDLFVGIILVTREIIEKSCIPFGLGSIGCRLISFIQVCRFSFSEKMSYIQVFYL